MTQSRHLIITPADLLACSCQINTEDFSGQFSSCSKDIGVGACSPLFTYLFFFFISWWTRRNFPSLAPSPPVEMAFLVRCYANCLQPWSSKVSDVVIPFLASASGLGCRRLCVCVCVCVCVRVCVCVCACVCVLLRRRDRVWMKENDLHAYDELLFCVCLWMHASCFASCF